MAANKMMKDWNDSEVKNWINGLTSLNDKQKQLICNGVDSIGCDGDSLACAETADELKDALEIPIILARKLNKAVQDYLKGGGPPAAGTAPMMTNQTAGMPLGVVPNNAPAQQAVAPAQPAAAPAAAGGAPESEEDVLQRLIMRNLAAKKQVAPPVQQMPGMGAPMGGAGFGGGGFGAAGMQQPQAQAAGGIKSVFSWGSNANAPGGIGGASGDFKVNVQGSNGKLICLNQKCNKHTKIKQVKQMLASQEGGDPGKMVMKHNGRTMDDMQNLGFYGIADSRNLITVTFKVVGGRV